MVLTHSLTFVLYSFLTDKEKKLLDDEMASIDGQMRQLASNHYKTFIHTADTSRTIHKDVCITVLRHFSYLVCEFCFNFIGRLTSLALQPLFEIHFCTLQKLSNGEIFKNIVI